MLSISVPCMSFQYSIADSRLCMDWLCTRSWEACRTTCIYVMCLPAQQRSSSYMTHKKVKSEYYLKTLSEAWLDLDPSQLWCFSWVLASFSAAAIGHPDRLKWQKRLQWRQRLRKCCHKHMCCTIFGSLECLSAKSVSLKRAGAHLSVSQSIPMFKTIVKKCRIINFHHCFTLSITTKLVTACLSLVERLKIILRIDIPIWTKVHFNVHSADRKHTLTCTGDPHLHSLFQ